MRPECINAVEKAIGRTITQAEARGIEDRVRSTMRRLAAKEPERWRTMPKAERLAEASRAIGEDVQAAAQLREQRTALQVAAHARHLPDVEQAGKQGFDVLQRKLMKLDSYIKGVHRQYWQQALDTMDFATKNDSGSLVGRGLRWISNLENPEKVQAFVREVFGQDTGDAGAKAAARAWLDTIEAMRERFNRAGGDVRKLAYSYLPQPHDVSRLVDAGLSRWVADVRGLIDRTRYTAEDGRMLRDDELAQVLEQAWRDLATDGLASRELGVFMGEGMLANRGSQHRVLHFKGPDEYLRYVQAYGTGTVYDAMAGHVRSMARNIGMTEELGPSPQATFRTLHDAARLGGGKDRAGLLSNTEGMWRTLAGEFDNPHSQTMARIGQGLRSIQVAGKLQRATLSAITDLPLLAWSMAIHKLPWWQAPMRVVQAFGGETRAYADRAGLMADSVISDIGRWGEGHLGRDFPDMLASATMKASLLDAWTSAVRRAFGVSMMGGLAKIARTGWDALDEADRARLASLGWEAGEWAELQKVKPERWRETDMLTVGSILRAEGIEPAMKDRLAARLLGTIDDESKFASPDPNLKTRTVQAGGLQRGTGSGELWRSLLLFKGFSLSVIFRHWDRVLHADFLTPAQRVQYGAALVAMPTLFGGMALQLGDLASGRDPRDVTGDMGNDPERLVRFWGAAMAKGGGLGFLGDMLLSGMGAQGQSGASAAVGGLAGPVVGSAFELVYDVGLENLREAAQGKETHAGAEAFRWARGHMPAVNLWYAGLVIDQAVMNELQEFLSPGYLAKQRGRMERQWASTWWWEPQDTGLASGTMTGPDRAPSFESIAGGMQ